MRQHLTISPSEAVDRLAIRELVEAYALSADGRDAQGQMSLFAADTHFVAYLNAKDPTLSPGSTREALAPVFADPNKYDATRHFVGQSTIFITATLSVHAGRLMLASLRYLDTFVKIAGAWLFAEHRLYVDWLE